jgi:hypothetical protein
MKLPHRQPKPKPLPERLLHSAAAGAGSVRLAIRQRSLRSMAMKRNPVEHDQSNPLQRVMRRAGLGVEPGRR